MPANEKKLTVNQSLEIALHNRIAAIKSLEAENTKLRAMVLKYVEAGSIETMKCSSLCAEGESCVLTADGKCYCGQA